MKKKSCHIVLLFIFLGIILGTVYAALHSEKTTETDLVYDSFEEAAFDHSEKDGTKVSSVLSADSKWGHVIAVAENGDVYEWWKEEQNSLRKVSELENIKEIVMGETVTYALDAEGILYRRDTETDTNILSSEFVNIYYNKHLERIAGIWDGDLVLASDDALIFTREKPMDYIPTHIEFSLNGQVDMNGVSDFRPFKKAAFVLDKENILWRIDRDHLKTQIIDEITRIFTKENHLFAVDTAGCVWTWRIDEEGEIWGEEEIDKRYEEVLELDEQNLLTSEGYLYLSERMWYQRDDPHYMDQRIVYYYHQVFITEAGDVFWVDEEKWAPDCFVYVMNLFFPPKEVRECEEDENFVYPGQEFSGKFANTESYILFLDENHTLYEWSLKRLRKRTDVDCIASVFVSQSRNYLVDEEGNVYVEERYHDIALGLQRLDIEKIQKIYASPHNDTVACCDGEKLIVILASDNRKLPCDIPCGEILNIQIFRENLLILKKDFTLWLVDTHLEKEQTQLEPRQLASNIRWMESNEDYFLAVDFEDVGYSWYPLGFDYYSKSEGFQNVTVTSGDFCMDKEGYLHDMFRGQEHICEEKVVYLWNNVFVTEEGEVLALCKEGESDENAEIEYLFNMRKLKNVSEKVQGVKSYDLNDKRPIEDKHAFEVQKIRTI